MPTGYEMLGEAIGGDSELAYQQGLNLGARTNEAMANARKRVDENTARENLSRTLEAAGIPRGTADASAEALRAGAGLGDVIGILGKQQEQGFRGIAGSDDPSVDSGARNRALYGVASGPVKPFEAVGARGYQDILHPESGVMPLGDAADGGGDAAAIQIMRAYGFLDETGRVRPGMERQAFDVMRSTMRLTDEGGVPGVVSANPFGRSTAPAGGGLGDVTAPPLANVPTTPAAAPASAGPAIAPISSVGRVAGNVAEIERAKVIGKETGQAQAELPIKEAKHRNQLQASERVIGNLDQVIADVSGWTAGPGGKLIGMVWGTPAYDLQAALGTIKGNIFVQQLQQMRYESPTGGALGQIAIQEMETMKAILGSLDTAQSPKQLRQMLQQVRTHYDLFKRNADDDFEEARRIATGGLMPGAQPAAGVAQAFASEADAEAAAAQGLIRPGDRITVGGVSGTWQ